MKAFLIALPLAVIASIAQAATNISAPDTNYRPKAKAQPSVMRYYILPPGGGWAPPKVVPKRAVLPAEGPQTIRINGGTIELRGTYDPGLPYFNRVQGRWPEPVNIWTGF